MFVVRGVSTDSLPWRVNSSADYWQAIARCEIEVIITAEHHFRLRSLLHYDKRPTGSRGLALKSVVGLEDLLLQVGDRLETNSTLQDVGDVWNLSVFPVCLKFWRRAHETIASRRCSLFDEALGITPDKSVCADTQLRVVGWQCGRELTFNSAEPQRCFVGLV